MVAFSSKQTTGHEPGNELGLALAAARAGDPAAFASLSEPYRHELLAHCYRMLGSFQEAEDLVQETLLRAWRRLETYEGRAPFRAWLYKIATNACLDALSRRPGRRFLPIGYNNPADPFAPLPPPVTEPVWIEPFPDELLAPTDSNPEARYDALESVSFAFLIALQALPPRQRCVLILSDVLDWMAVEIADALGITVSAVTSLLYRARTSLKQLDPSRKPPARSQVPVDEHTQLLLDRYLRAWESADIDEIVSMLKEDATFPMPPLPVWFQGRFAIRAFISSTVLAGDALGRWRLLPIRANARPGFAFYRLDEETQMYFPYAIQVLNFAGELLADVITFGIPNLFAAFGLPAQLGRIN